MGGGGASAARLGPDPLGLRGKELAFFASGILPFLLTAVVGGPSALTKSNYSSVRTTGEVLLLPSRRVFRDLSQDLAASGLL